MSESRRPQIACHNRTLLYGTTEHKAVPQAIRHWNQLLGVDNEVLQIPVDKKGGWIWTSSVTMPIAPI